MNFSELEKEYQRLKGQFEAGTLTEEDFKARLKELMIQDGEGRWWMIGYETGQWFVHDSENWVRSEPPHDAKPSYKVVGRSTRTGWAQKNWGSAISDRLPKAPAWVPTGTIRRTWRSVTRSGEPLHEASVSPASDGDEVYDLIRYPDLECPTYVKRNERFSLIAGLLLEPPDPEAEPIQIEDSGDPDHPPEVELVLRARGFEIEGSNTKVVEVARDEDTEARFVLIAKEEGEQQIRLDYYQHGRRIGTVRRNVLVAEAAAETAQPGEAAYLELHGEPQIPAPDLEITVELDRRDGRTLYFELHSTKEEVDAHRRKAGQVKLQGSPLEKMQSVYNEMSYMARYGTKTSKRDRDEAERRLESIGRTLWDDLIPDDLKEEYWRFKDLVVSVLITADEPWIPWEMVKPYRFDESGQREDDRFWCQQFTISRWLSGPGAVELLPVGTARPVAPTDMDLPAVRGEVAFIEQLGQLRGDIAPLTAIDRKLQVIDLLESGDFSLLHFACHGQFDAATPDNSAIALTDGELRPSDIQTRFGGDRPRPLIFLNACHGARMEFGFTGLGGWADCLVQRSRAGAFVGAQWEVNDSLALEFTVHFYKELFEQGATTAGALRAAREHIRESAPYNSTWLAYALYADPESRVVSQAM